jgi:hypothetical protein
MHEWVKGWGLERREEVLGEEPEDKINMKAIFIKPNMSFLSHSSIPYLDLNCFRGRMLMITHLITQRLLVVIYPLPRFPGTNEFLKFRKKIKASSKNFPNDFF